MATIDTSRPAPFGAITTYRAIQGVSNVFAAVSDWNEARLTRAALSRLSDHELNDIGLCRADIEDIAQRKR